MKNIGFTKFSTTCSSISKTNLFSHSFTPTLTLVRPVIPASQSPASSGLLFNVLSNVEPFIVTLFQVAVAISSPSKRRLKQKALITASAPWNYSRFYYPPLLNIQRAFSIKISLYICTIPMSSHRKERFFPRTTRRSVRV